MYPLVPAALAMLACLGPAQDEPAADDTLTIDWGKSEYALVLPRGEHLRYRVRVGLGIVEAPVGNVTMSAGVEPYRESVLLLGTNGGGETKRETAWMRVHARGDYKLYSMDATIESRVHPVEWPWIVYNYKQEGSKNRRRENSIGWKDGRSYLRYRRDTHHGAPPGTRIWKDPRDRELSVEPLDMLTAVYYARTMIREDLDSMVFPIADKLDLWEIRLRRGEVSVQETAAGRFETVKILLEPRPYPGEVTDDTSEKEKTFEGLFGIHGSIELWVDRKTGVPVRVTGDIPIGLIDLAVDVVLKSYSGTPKGFRPVG